MQAAVVTHRKPKFVLSRGVFLKSETLNTLNVFQSSIVVVFLKNMSISFAERHCLVSACNILFTSLIFRVGGKSLSIAK